MKRPSRKERFLYWFDNQMARGSLSLIRLLVIATILIILLLAFIISAFDAEVGLFVILCLILSSQFTYFV